ncbi:MAG: hypothetical protein ACRDWX_11965 [Acidimicrobiia bacterium]
MSITGVGSLPHTDPDEAARFVLEAAQVPYLPQLPHRHPEEGMLVQWGDGLCGSGAAGDGIGLRYGAPVGPRQQAFRGAEALIDLLPRQTPLVKSQATGPVTLALGLLAAGHPGAGLWDCVVEGLLRRVENHLRWLEERLPEAEVVLLFDEPGLAGLQSQEVPLSPADVRALLGTVLDGVPIPAGLHCCADTDWSLVASLRPDWISWDVSALGPGFAQAGQALAEAVMEGTRIIWGVVPTQMGPLPRDDELIARLRRAEAALVLGGADLARLEAGAWYSPACGLAGLSESQAEEVCRRVRVLAGELSAHG